MKANEVFDFNSQFLLHSNFRNKTKLQKDENHKVIVTQIQKSIMVLSKAIERHEN